MKHLKIGIVEDDLLIAASIELALSQSGYHPVKPVRSYDKAVKMIEDESPDLLILDITLEGRQDGIDLGMKVSRDYRIPFIFLTAYSDSATVNRAKKANPYAYLVKPFNEHDLFTSIEIAFNNYNHSAKSAQAATVPASLKDAVFIKEGDLFYKVLLHDILYVESDNVYLNIYTTRQHHIARMKLEDFLQDFSHDSFFRVHRSYAVNIKHVEAINSLTVNVAGKEVPLQPLYRKELLQIIRPLR